MDKIRIGVLGVKRGTSMIYYCEHAQNAEVVAICDKWEEGLRKTEKELNDDRITFYTDFDEFINHDMDAVVLANYGNEHAPFAIRCLNRGLHVYSEVTACQHMKEAVELVEAVERSGKVYALGEQYCFMPATMEMKRLYQAGKIGELELADCEYAHDASGGWHRLTFGEPGHWRNYAYSTFYCTHSIGPILHATGLRPVSVTGFESYHNERRSSVGAKTASFGISMLTLNNGAIVKALNGNLRISTLWYCMYGSEGKLENSRSILKNGGISLLNAEFAEKGSHENYTREYYTPERPPLKGDFETANFNDHGGADYYCMQGFIDRIRGDENADYIDVYEAMDMTLPGMFAYRSLLQGGIPLDVPDLRDPAQRDLYRNDTTCTDPKAAGDMLVPAYSRGEVEIDPAVYERVKNNFIREMEDGTFQSE